MDSKAEKIALFRYGLIATLVLEKLPRGEMIRRARELAEHDYDIPFSDRRHISVETLLHWAARYRTGGLEALAPQSRGMIARSMGCDCARSEAHHSGPGEDPHHARQRAIGAGHCRRSWCVKVPRRQHRKPRPQKGWQPGRLCEPRSLNHDDVLIVGRFGFRRHVVACSRFTAVRNVLVCE